MRGRGEPAGGGSWEGPASRQRWWTVTRPRGLFESSPSAGSRRCSGSQVLTKKTRATGVAVAVTTRLGAAAAGGACAAQRSSRWREQRPWRPPPRPPCARAPCPSTGGARRHAGHTRHAPARARHARVTPPRPATAGHPPQRADTSALRGSEGGSPYLTCRRRRPWLSASVRSAHLSGVVATDHVHGGRTVASRRRPRSRLGPCQGQPNEAGPRVARYYFEDHVLYRGGAPKGLRAAHRPKFFFSRQGFWTGSHRTRTPSTRSVFSGHGAPRKKRTDAAAVFIVTAASRSTKRTNKTNQQRWRHPHPPPPRYRTAATAAAARQWRPDAHKQERFLRRASDPRPRHHPPAPPVTNGVAARAPQGRVSWSRAVLASPAWSTRRGRSHAGARRSRPRAPSVPTRGSRTRQRSLRSDAPKASKRQTKNRHFGRPPPRVRITRRASGARRDTAQRSQPAPTQQTAVAPVTAAWAAPRRPPPPAVLPLHRRRHRPRAWTPPAAATAAAHTRHTAAVEPSRRPPRREPLASWRRQRPAPRPPPAARW